MVGLGMVGVVLVAMGVVPRFCPQRTEWAHMIECGGWAAGVCGWRLVLRLCDKYHQKFLLSLA